MKQETKEWPSRMNHWKEDEWTEEIYHDVYTADFRDVELENDELSSWEAAFMDGYERAE